jgi:hypothetical protein
MTVKGEGHHDTQWQQTQVGRATGLRGHCPPAASADRMLFPMSRANKQQASKRLGLDMATVAPAGPPPGGWWLIRGREQESEREHMHCGPFGSVPRPRALPGESAPALHSATPFLTCLICIPADTGRPPGPGGLHLARR